MELGRQKAWKFYINNKQKIVQCWNSIDIINKIV